VRARILPLDDLAEFGKTDRVALLLTLSPGEAREIMDGMGGGTYSAMPHNARKLYEALEIISHPDGAVRQAGRDALNTEGRSGVKGVMRRARPSND
jgi:hypothetical protein